MEGDQGSKNRLYSNYLRSAKRRNIEFSLTREQFFNLVFLKCHYCEIPPFNTTKTINKNGAEHFLYNGIDRMNDKEGYTVKNSVPCCKQCNLAKNTQTYENFISYIKRLGELQLK